MPNPPDAGERNKLEALVAVMAALRTPVTGCPWDLEQNFGSIAPYTLEEAYEVADAIARGDLVDLREELGDLLLQVVFHSRLAEEQGAFTLPDVIRGITEKMVRRHPHVFGDEAARSAGAAKGWWEAIKAEEKTAKAAERRARGLSVKTGKDASVLADIPANMPALTHAIKLQAAAARVKFDWSSITPVFDKLREEIAELETEVVAKNRKPAAVAEEFGDLMFVMANLARHLELDPEACLRNANEKFRRRFQGVERRLGEQGKTPAQSNLAEMDALWDAEKISEKSVQG